MTPESRILGGLYGSLVGDALGVPVEFKPRRDRVSDPVTDMRDYGTHRQPKGTWSDDGAMLLCSVESLVEKAGFEPQDMGERFLKWFDEGRWAAHGEVFDIGIATRTALGRIRQGVPAESAGGTGQYDNGNGSLMRMLPVGMALSCQEDGVLSERVQCASSITHGHERSRLACVFHAMLTSELLISDGVGPQEALERCQGRFLRMFQDHPEILAFRNILSPKVGDLDAASIRSGGYVMETLTASVWCLLTTSEFSECVLKAVNLGDDTDTTGCVAGGLAGVLYGLEAIPPEWIRALPRQSDLKGLFDRFLKLTGTPL